MSDASVRLLRTAAAMCPSSFSMLGHADEPLREYAKRLYSNGGVVNSALAEQSRSLLAKAIGRHVKQAGGDGEVVESEVMTSPVMQTGPHHRLAFDDDFCSTLALSLIGSSAEGRAANVIFTCSTNTLEERARRGPAWLRTNAEPTRVFDVPRRTLSKRSVVAFDDLVHVSPDLDHWARTTLPRDVDIDVHSTARPVREHISRINDQFFGQLAEGSGVETVALQDGFFAQLIAETLEEPSFLRRLFEDERMIVLVDRLNAAAIAPHGCFVPNSTDLFWAIVNGRVRQLTLIDHELRSPRYGISIPLDPATLVRHLRAGFLVPSLFLVFCAASILPAGRALGGSHQASYHEVFQRIVLDVLDTDKQDERELFDEIRSRALVGWGHNVIAHNALSDIVSVRPGTATFSERLGDTGLSEVSAGFAAFVADERWQSLTSSITASHPNESEPTKAAFAQR